MQRTTNLLLASLTAWTIPATALAQAASQRSPRTEGQSPGGIAAPSPQRPSPHPPRPVVGGDPSAALTVQECSNLGGRVRVEAEYFTTRDPICMSGTICLTKGVDGKTRAACITRN
jgi:hypothetical protein